MQVGAAGALRGFKDTAVPMALCVFSYWAVGFPLAYVLGVRYGLGPAYVWIGLIAGLTVSAVLLVVRFRKISRCTAAIDPLAISGTIAITSCPDSVAETFP